MKIGIDVSSLQGPHRMRGIGYTMAHFLSNLQAGAEVEYVFFVD